MKSILPRLAVMSVLAVAMALAPTQMAAQENQEKPAVEKKPGPTGDRGIPFHGKVTALDKTAKTVTVGDRVFQITSTTKIKKNGKPATFDDGAVGDDCGGTYTKGDDGKLRVKTLRFGPKPNGTGKKAKTE